MRANAHAPYSKFHVGAAILDENGQIHAGCNVENAAYPQSQCAEASAIGAMVAAGGKRIKVIVIVGPDGVFCAPCGGCRQRIAEFAAEDTTIAIAMSRTIRLRASMSDLLPAEFSRDQLT